MTNNYAFKLTCIIVAINTSKIFTYVTIWRTIIYLCWWRRIGNLERMYKKNKKNKLVAYKYKSVWNKNMAKKRKKNYSW